jgi:hypothetical protein
MARSESRIYEVTFCSRVAGWMNALFAQHPEWPFRRAEIEESLLPDQKRSDLRVYGDAERLILAGEVKMPDSVDGRSPYNSKLVDDAAWKADNAGGEFFFTWNVNHFVLFDRKKWHLPILQRRVQDYPLGLQVSRREEINRPEIEAGIQAFLAEFFADFAPIAEGQRPDWGMRLDEWFIRAFEHHVLWPVKLTAEHLWAQADSHKPFDHRLQEWLAREQGWLFARNDPAQWRDILDRAARTLCYVFANRLIFYESCRAKFSDSLAPLEVPAGLNGAALYDHFQKVFQEAVQATGDYETLFYPYEKDWAGPLIFAHPDSAEAWRSVIQNLEPFNFKLIPADVLGGIFRRLVDPEERHKFGQHFTNEDLVDVVNAFCIRDPEAAILDPASGSGSFVVRGYHRKGWLKQDRRYKHASVSHQDWLRQIHAVDISLFAAHLCTLNLAARDLRDEENYPRVRRGNFFEVADDVSRKKPFCLLPEGLQGERRPGPIHLPSLDAVVGNPPYVRQELIPKRSQKGLGRMQAKEDLQEMCARFWPGLKLSGRSDLHCYFWPAAAKFLKEGGWFGFLVSSSWLDVEYGFALQAWVLENFRIHAILESNAEPWFEDARVKTCAVILQRCSAPAARQAQLVRFVRLDLPLKTILGERPDENGRQTAAERFREDILACKKNTTREGWRVVVKKQQDLWEEGVRAGRLFAMQRQRDLAEGLVSRPVALPDDEDENGLAKGENEGAESEGFFDEGGNGYLHEDAPAYGAVYGGGKWGKYLRAPDLYFRIMEQYGERFVPLGEIATIRFGVKSGCDAFFMPRDVSAKFLEKYSESDWKNAPLMTHCKRGEITSGEVKLLQAGDGTVHPVEAADLRPVLHSMMTIRRPVTLPEDLDWVLMVSKSKNDLKGHYTVKYLRYGETHDVATNKKAAAATVASRPTCAGRDPWYDLTYTKPGHLIWAKGQQYRHVVVFNAQGVTANCRLYDVTLVGWPTEAARTLAAIANSTLVAYFKTFYGRYTGTEGGFEMMALDLNLLEIPDPRHASKPLARKLEAAFSKLCERDTRRMVEEEFLDCHSAKRAQKLAEQPLALPSELQMPDRRALDLAVLELIGVKSADEREALCDELYRATAAHFRQIRLVEIQKQEQRAGGEARAFRTDELAADLWDALTEDEQRPLAQWLAAQTSAGQAHVILEGRASLAEANDFLDASTVFFRQSAGGKVVSESVVLPSRAHAEIIFKLSQLGLRGSVRLPERAQAAGELRALLEARLAAMASTALHLAHSRTSDERRAADLSGLLQHWMIHGKPATKPEAAHF